MSNQDMGVILDDLPIESHSSYEHSEELKLWGQLWPNG